MFIIHLNLSENRDNYKEQSAAIEEVDFNEGFLEIFMSKVFELFYAIFFHFLTKSKDGKLLP